MNKDEQIQVLASVIKQMEIELFKTIIDEQFWQLQAIGSNSYNQILGQVQTKKKMLENQLPYYKDKLKDIEAGDYNYEDRITSKKR